MKRSTVASLAILKVNYERRGKDYIDNFVPFVVEAIRTSADDIVSLPALQETLRNQFGLSLPLNPLRHILQRAAREGFLRRDGGVFYREPDACSRSTFAEIQQEVGAIQSNVTVALRDFARDQHSVEWTEEYTEQALLSFVADTGLDVLFASAERSVLPKPSLAKGTSFIVASFVAECRLKLPVLFEDIETIIKGALLANALYFTDAGKIAQRFKNTRVYLDTSILIYYLGYAGSDRRAPCAELVSLLKDYGADLRCFRQTLEEASGILDSCAARIRKGQLRDAYGPSIEYFVTQGLTSTDIDLLAARLPHKLASLGIEVEEKPTYKHKHEFVIDEPGFQAKLKNEVGYHSDKALQHDVDCVSAIARLREGRDSYYVENCGAIFVTPNYDLARITRAFFQAECSPGAVALCISDYALGYLLWLKNPMMAPDLPRRRLIADAYAAMEPPDELWKAYLVEIARLETKGEISAEDYMLLRHVLSAKAALMDLTKGDASAFTQGTVAEILEVAKRNLRADLEAQLAVERKQRAAAESSLVEQDELHSERLVRLRRVASSIAAVVANGGLVVGMAGLGIATLYTFPWQLPNLSGSWLRYARTIILLLLFAYLMASMVWGTTLSGLARRLQEKLESTIEHNLRQWMQL